MIMLKKQKDYVTIYSAYSRHPNKLISCQLYFFWTRPWMPILTKITPPLVFYLIKKTSWLNPPGSIVIIWHQTQTRIFVFWNPSKITINLHQVSSPNMGSHFMTPGNLAILAQGSATKSTGCKSTRCFSSCCKASLHWSNMANNVVILMAFV